MTNHEEKAKRVTSVRNSIDRDDVERMLPEVNLIEDDEIRDKTIKILTDASPPSFWKRATSSTGKYHPKDERGEYGNLLHTKRVSIMFRNLAQVDVEMGLLSEYEYDCGQSAALLHDLYKYSWPSENNKHTVKDHDIIASSVAEHIGNLPPEVNQTIHSHMSKWGAGKDPETRLEWLLCRADKAVSPDWSTIGVYHPPKELREHLGVVGYDVEGRIIDDYEDV